MMSCFRIVLLFIIIFSRFTPCLSDVGWQKDYYKKYTFKEFYKYPPVNTKINISNIDSNLMSAALFYATNKARVLNNVQPLKYSDVLRKAAYLQAYYMVKKNYFSSISPLSKLKTLKQRIKKFGKYFGVAVENIAMEYGIKYDSGKKYFTRNERNFYYENGQRIPLHTYISFAEKVIKQWMKSPPHRKNILDPVFKRLGAGAWFYYKNNGMLIAKVSHCMAQGTND